MEPLGNRDALVRRLAAALHGHDDPRRHPATAPARERAPADL